MPIAVAVATAIVVADAAVAATLWTHKALSWPKNIADRGSVTAVVFGARKYTLQHRFRLSTCQEQENWPLSPTQQPLL